MRDNSLFVVEHHVDTPHCPTVLLRSDYESMENLRDITLVGDPCRRFINTQTGEVIDPYETMKRYNEWLRSL